MNDQPLPSDQEFPLSFNGYAAFDALSLKQLMKQRLNQNGVFTDQVFEGSNFNNLLDVVAYSYNVLLYYLNQTSNESLFSNAQLYENMNKIVKLINYKPVGVQTSILNYKVEALSDLAAGVYTIPRFSYITINDIYYSFNSDLTFIKNLSTNENLTQLSDFSFLYQGTFIEYPLIIAAGEDFEEFSIVALDGDNNNLSIDFNNIYVFIRDNSGKWKEWEKVDSLFLQNGAKSVFEARLNENQRYSIKFGNNISGKKLKAGDVVAIYFLKSDKELGNVGANTLFSNELFLFNTPQYQQIMSDIRDQSTNVLTPAKSKFLTFTNDNASVPASELETSEQIRKNAPNFLKQQGRLVTTTDIASYITTNFSNFISDAAVVNNWEYIDGHIRYLYNLGIEQPMLDSRVLSNQVMFADSCNFNNIYIYCVPRLLQTNGFTQTRGILAPGVRDLIIRKLDKLKMSTIEFVLQDPVYYGIGLGIATQDEVFNKMLSLDILDETKLEVVKNNNSSLNSIQIKRKIADILTSYFNFKNTKLGQTIDIQSLTQQILNVDGVDGIYTTRNNLTLPGLNLLGFNTVYNAGNEDIKIISQNTVLPYFQIPFWFKPEIIENQIEVLPSELISAGVREY